ncbi:hypothetical protein OESDEN_23502, partial [Oesophagostomum dentatum]
MQGDLARFYYIPTYNKIKEKLQKANETEKAFSLCSTSTEECAIPCQAAASTQEKSTEFTSVQQAANTDANLAPSRENLERVSETQLGEVGKRAEGSDIPKNASNEETIRDINPLPMKRIKLEPSRPPPKLFPRDRPPDDIPVYDYTKV